MGSANSSVKKEPPEKNRLMIADSLDIAERRMQLLGVGEDIFSLVLSFLRPTREIFRASRVCKSWYIIIMGKETIWRMMLLGEHLPPPLRQDIL